jgi:hypothetical protein
MCAGKEAGRHAIRWAERYASMYVGGRVGKQVGIWRRATSGVQVGGYEGGLVRWLGRGAGV